MTLIAGTDFSGLGSCEEALKRLKVDHRIAFACEKDKYAKNSYLANHTPELFYDDITQRIQSETPASDLYCFGFPCQAFSLAGNRKGFEDTRGTLFFNSLSYIKEKQPRVFLGENVKGLLSHDKVKGSKSKHGRTFGVIRDALALTINGQHNIYKYDDCVNYHLFYQVLNTKEYGIPQNRERIFIVGFRDEEDAVRFKFPKKIPLRLKLTDLLEKEVDPKYYLSETAIKRLLRRESFIPQINLQITGTLNTKNNSGQLSFDSGTTLISEEISKSDLANSRTRLVKSTDSISPTIMANQAKQSTDSILINEVEKPEKKQVFVVNENGALREIDISMSIDANYGKGMDNHGQRSMILEGCEDFEVKVAFRSRNEEAKQIRKKNLQKEIDTNPFAKKDISFKQSEVMNTITTSHSDEQLILINESPANKLIPMFGTEENRRATRVYDANGIACTQSANGGGGGEKTGLYLIGHKIRRLTPREVFRLFGYSDEFFEKCSSINSDTQLYKQAGNSIVVDTILHLLIQILTALKIPFYYV